MSDYVPNEEDRMGDYVPNEEDRMGSFDRRGDGYLLWIFGALALILLIGALVL